MPSQDTQFKKGHTPWSKGKEVTKEQRDKISIANTGKRFPQELFPNKGMRGKKHLEESILRMSLTKLGKPSKNKGKKLIYSKEGIENIRKAHKGKTPWNKGLKETFKHTNEWKEKVRLRMMGKKNNLGKKFPKELYPNYALRGKKHKEETILKMKGRTPWNKNLKGTHFSLNTEFKKGMIPWNKDKEGYHIHSEEHKKELGKRMKGIKYNLGRKFPEELYPNHSWRGKNHLPWNKDKHIQTNTGRTHITKERRANQIFPMNDTKIEVKIQNFLKQLGIEFFTHQYIKDIEHSYQCDILIPSMNLIIECDGDYWHKYPIGKDIDKIRTSELISKGFKVLRLWEHEINKMNLNLFKERLNW